MKKFTLATTISLILTITIFSSAVAALPGNGWWTALFMQNIGEDSGSISMTAYDLGSSSTYGSLSYSVDSDKTIAYDPGVNPDYPTGNYIGFDSSLPSGFQGSAVVSASQEIASIAQIANFQNGSVGTSSGKASAFYQGISQGSVATRLLATTIKHNYSGATTTLYIQAAGSDSDVTINYRMSDGSVHEQTETIPANRTFVFDPANAIPPIASDECGVDTSTSPCYGSAVITATTPVGGVLLEHPHSGTPINFIQAIRLATPNDESTRIYVPSVKNDFTTGSGTGIAGAAVMNVGTEPALVQITLTITALGRNAPSGVVPGQEYSETVEIQPNENYLFSKWLGNIGGMPAGTMAAAVIESIPDATHTPQPLVGSSNDAKTQNNFPGQAKVKYSAFADNTATPLAYGPMVKEFYGIFTGGVTVQNVGDNPDFITIEYHQYASNNVYVFRTINEIPVGGATQTNWVSVTGSDNFSPVGGDWEFADLAGHQYSVVAYTGSSQNIILMVTENTPSGTLDIARYEGINK